MRAMPADVAQCLWAERVDFHPEHVECGGLALGIDAPQTYEQVRAELPSGSVVVLYTDGVIEARRGSDLFGSERLGERAREPRPDGEDQPVERLDVLLVFSSNLQDDAAYARGGRKPLERCGIARGRGGELQRRPDVAGREAPFDLARGNRRDHVPLRWIGLDTKEVEEEVEVELTWDPPWTPELMSDDAKFILGFG